MRRLIVVVYVAAFAASPALADERFRLTPDESGQIPYFIAEPAEHTGYRPGDSNLVIWAVEEWQRRVGSSLRFRRVEDAASALLHIRWLPWAEDASLGRMDPTMVRERVVAMVDIRPDEARFRPSVLRRVKTDPLMRDVVLYYVCLHEIGHALGLSHSDNPRDLMWPGANGVTLPIYERYRHHLKSRDDIPRVDWLSPRDVDRVKQLFAPGTTNH